MRLKPADHKLSEDEIRQRFGALIEEGIEAIRRDPWLLVEMAEDAGERAGTFTRVEHREAYPRINWDEHEDALREAFARGEPGGAIAERLGLRESTVFAKWRSWGLNAEERPRSQVKRESRRPPEVIERERLVREHAAQGLTQEASAEALGISAGAVGQIRRRLGIKSSGNPPRHVVAGRRARVCLLRAMGHRPGEIVTMLGITRATYDNDIVRQRRRN